MSRTRHHGKRSESTRDGRKKVQALKRIYDKTVRMQDWYIEIPVSTTLGSKMTGGGRA